jgi:predicted nucleic acid-binding protein
VHNVLLVLARRGRLDTDGYEAAVSALAALDVELESPSWAQVEHAVTRLARLHGLSIYDAAYLELALRERLPLATFDSDLARAARKEGLASIA